MPVDNGEPFMLEQKTTRAVKNQDLAFGEQIQMDSKEFEEHIDKNRQLEGQVPASLQEDAMNTTHERITEN